MKKLQEMHAELLERNADVLERGRAFGRWLIVLLHAILIVSSICIYVEDTRHMFWIRRKLNRMLREHDREMRKLGYRGP